MFVVNRLNWHPYEAGFTRLPGEFRVASFATVEEAEAERQRLEAEVRAFVNPFGAGVAPVEQSNMPELVLCDWLQDHDIEPAKPDSKTKKRDWADWWTKAAKKWSAEQRVFAWEALDRMRFFEVTEEHERSKVYAVAEAHGYPGQEYYFGLHSAHQSQKQAKQKCAKQNEEIDWDDEEHGPDEEPKRKDPIAPFHSRRDYSDYDYFEDRPVGNWPDGQIFHYTVPIEVEGQLTKNLFVVARIIFGEDEHGCFVRKKVAELVGYPAYSFVRGFGSKKAAEVFCQEKIRQAQEAVAPTRILPPDEEELDSEELVEGIRGLGLSPPNPDELSEDPTQLGRWWRTAAEVVTPEQRVALWKLLNVPLFEVLETKLAD